MEKNKVQTGASPFIEMSRVIQGEGSLMGRPFLLLRVWGCPYRCRFGESVCDTSYAWNQPSDCFGVDEAIRFIEENDDIDNIMITGGEPTFWEGEAMPRLMREVGEMSKHVLVETAGYRIPSWFECVDSWSVSPKVGVAGASVNWLPIIRMLSVDSSYIKFVVMSKDHAEDILALIEGNFPDVRDRVWLMPEGTDWDMLRKTRPIIYDFCSEKNVRFSDRLHIVAFGEEVKGK